MYDLNNGFHHQVDIDVVMPLLPPTLSVVSSKRFRWNNINKLTTNTASGEYKYITGKPLKAG